MSFENDSIISSNSEKFNDGFFFLSFFMSFCLDNYFSFFSFLPIAFSNMPLRVAPDFVAPSPNFAIRDFSSSICAALTLNLILLLFRSISVIFASKALSFEKLLVLHLQSPLQDRFSNCYNQLFLINCNFYSSF